jgi:hypothetical protein
MPLQTFIKIKLPPYGGIADLFFCWEMHQVADLRKNTLTAANVSTVMYWCSLV